MTGHAEHSVEHTRIRDATIPELGVDHDLTRGGRVGHESSGQWSVVGYVNKTTAADRWPLILLLAPADAHVEADHTVLVAGADKGNVTIHIVLPLNDLL